MSDLPSVPPPEDPRHRFRRLLSSTDEDSAQDEGEIDEGPVQLEEPVNPQAEPDTGLSETEARADEDLAKTTIRPADASLGPTIPGLLDQDITPVSRHSDAPPLSGIRDEIHQPAIGEDGRLLPRWINEVDLEATKVTPVASH